MELTIISGGIGCLELIDTPTLKDTQNHGPSNIHNEVTELAVATFSTLARGQNASFIFYYQVAIVLCT